MNRLSDLKNIAYLSIGSNMGDRINNCRKGISLLGKSEGIAISGLSGCYLTEPVEFEDQSWFVNAVVKIRTSLDPFRLLKMLKSIEMELGRVPAKQRYGPRILDFDIILYNDEIMDTPELVVPHPRMSYREFVLRPLYELCPKKVHPVLKKTIEQLLGAIKKDGPQCIRIPQLMLHRSLSYDRHQPSADQEEIKHEVFY